jgi:hypothetical protein
MKTVRRLLYRDIVASVVFVALAFLSLFYFIDFVDELEGVGSRGRTAWPVRRLFPKARAPPRPRRCRARQFQCATVRPSQATPPGSR